MMVTVALPQGWSEFARQKVGEERLRAAVIQFLRGSVQLPADPGEGPELFQLYVPEDFDDYFGLNGHHPEMVVRRALAAFVSAARRQAPVQQRARGEKTQDDSAWSPARAALVLKAVLFIGVGAGTWILMRSGRVEPDTPRSEGEKASVEDYSSWEPEP